MPNHRAGGKFAGSHSTLIDAAVVVADTAAARPEVSKIVLGFIIGGKKNRRPRVKITPIQAGLRVVVCGNIAIQEMYVYTSDPPLTQKAIEAAFGG